MTTKTLPAGYRLDSVEWYGWGTFHDIWKMQLGGETTLLTGANGSGKSTILDALLTLLIPTVERNYNQAAGGKKTDRSVESYLLGRHGKIRVGNTYQDQDIREKDGYHVLVAIFKNYPLDQTVTLAQVYWWSNGAIQNVQVISEQVLTVKQHFNFRDNQHIKRALQQIPNTTVYSTFKAYDEEFRRIFHMGEKATTLINKIVAIKEIPKLDEFVRENMLEEVDIHSSIVRLRDKFRDLDDIYEKIKAAEEQERILKPLVKNNQDYQKNIIQLRDVHERLNNAPIFFADRRIHLLQSAMTKLEQQMEAYWQDIERYDNQLDELRDSESRLQIALSQNSVQREIETIELEIKTLDAEITRRQSDAKIYYQFLAPLNLPEAVNEVTFEQNKTAIRNEQTYIEQRNTDLQQQVNELGAKRNQLQAEFDVLEEEIESLKGRKTQIDRTAINIRDELTQALKIDPEHLPYVGELLQVREDAAEWESALQYLLRDFALKMLVPKQFFKRVSEYVETHNLKGRLDYDHITETIPVPNLDPRSIFHKLEVKPNNPFGTNVIAGMLAGQFGDYITCDTLEEFHNHYGKAITRNRHIKRSRSSYTKDDRPQVIDPSKYRLGWDNTQKIERLQEQQHEIRQKINTAQQEIATLTNQQKSLRNDTVAIERLLSFGEFSQLDWRSVQQEREAKRQRQDELRKSNDTYRDLEAQLKTKQAEIQQLEQTRDTSKRDSAKLEERWDGYSKQLDNDNRDYPPDERERKIAVFGLITSDIPDRITLENEREIEKNYQAYLRNEAGTLTEENNRLTNLMTRRMQDYNNRFQELAVDLVPDEESINEYLARYQHIVEQDLPQHETRFKDLLRRHVGDEISSFKGNLEKQYDVYKQRIEGLNRSLAQIEYDKQKKTYIQLITRSTNHSEVQAFKRELEQCIPDPSAEQDGIDERQYDLIRKLIERLFDSNEQRWCSHVTDVRNWLDIDAQEFSKETHEVRQVYESSSGKSGGEKAKLAYTILASAIAYQYGLHDEWHRNERFRFVMVDEVFSKSDEQNAHYAMELFQTLHLQVLVVTPSDKMHIVLPYIGTCCLVAKPNQDNSKLVTMRIHDIDEFRQHLEEGTLEVYVAHHAGQD